MRRFRTSFTFPVTTLAGSSLSNIRSICRGHHIEAKYLPKFYLTLVVAAILSIFTYFEKRKWQRKIESFAPQKPPVFIIGFWRSGTTLLHNLLCQDPDAAYTTTFHTVFPNLVLSQTWLKHVINFLLPPQRPYDNVSMDMDYPQEEDFGLMNLQPVTIYKFFIFPKDFDRIVDDDLHLENLPPDKVESWKKAYLNMMAKAGINTRGSRYVGKNPCHLGRIRLLKKMFPDAKFIFIHRDPYKVNESLYNFILSIFPGVKLQDIPHDFSRKQTVRMYADLMNTYFKEKESIPESDIYELSLNDLKDNAEEHIRKIYQKFGIENFDESAPRIRKYLRENPVPRLNSNLPTEETIRLVDTYAGDIVRKLGYNPFSQPEKEKATG